MIEMINFKWLFPDWNRKSRESAKPNVSTLASSSVEMASSSYEFMLESLMEVPTDRFDRWHTRQHRAN
jgi:hypothetical protein